MTAPKRIQRRRTRGWTLPANTVVVGRGSKLGNPFVCDDPAQAVAVYDRWLNRERVVLPDGVTCKGACFVVDREAALRAIEAARGMDVACWCPEGAPCHGDVILRRANA